VKIPVSSNESDHVAVAVWSELPDRMPRYALVAGVDLVVIRWGENVSVLYGRCAHRGALLADGAIVGENLVCSLHGWDYRYDTGVSAYDNRERLHRFRSWIDDDRVLVDAHEIHAWACEHPQGWDRSAYQGVYQDPHGAPEEPHVAMIRQLATDGLASYGSHGPMVSMGVPRDSLPSWDDIQLVTAQLARRPLLEGHEVTTATVIGPNARRPITLSMPIFVSDMSFGALSEEAKVALARGAQLADTAICSGEGGMLPEEQAENRRYIYELASGGFGWSWDIVHRVQGFHFKFGQGAKTGTGGHLPGRKVTARIAEVRGLLEGHSAVSPATFVELTELSDFRRFADEVRERSEGIPIGAKLSAQHIEDDLDAALHIGVDYVILDGRGGGTGAAPALFRDHISVPTIPALARARRHLDRRGRRDITLVITGGLRTHTDFTKALALGADAVAIANAALQAIGCLGMRACASDACPVGIATQRADLRSRLVVDDAAPRLARFLFATCELMTTLARACGHRRLSDFTIADLTTFQPDTSHLAGVAYGGIDA
jgi:glutamate synthase domain-containing protein 2/nitrite reductase/ring-hydroxylating ferredoxin subunit